MSETVEQLQKIIEQLQANATESIGLAGERMGTIAALRYQIAHLEEFTNHFLTADGVLMVESKLVWWPGVVRSHLARINMPTASMVIDLAGVEVGINDCYSTEALSETARAEALAAVGAQA